MFLLVFLALGVAGASAASTNNVISVAAFTLAWVTSAVTRLAELRRGERPAIKLSRLNLRQAVVFAFGGGSWVVLGVLQNSYASSIVWKPIEVPLLLRALGLVLAAAAIAEPFFERMRKSAATEPGWPGRADDATVQDGLSVAMMVRSGAVVLLSGSPLLALMCALWLGVTLWPLASAAESLRLRRFTGSPGYADRVDDAIPATLT